MKEIGSYEVAIYTADTTLYDKEIIRSAYWDSRFLQKFNDGVEIIVFILRPKTFGGMNFVRTYQLLKPNESLI